MFDLGNIPDSAQQPVGNPRRAARPLGDFVSPGLINDGLQQARGSHDDSFEIVGVVELKRDTIPNRSRSGLVSMPARVVAPTKVKVGCPVLLSGRLGPHQS